MQNVWIIIGNIALIASALTTSAVVIAYSFSRFEISQVGRQFWLTKFLLALILDFGAMNLLVTGSSRHTSAPPVRAIIYILVVIIMLRWFIIIIRTQREVHRKKHPVWDAPETPPSVRRDS